MLKRQRGFTLVELITVIAVIGILATIGVFGFSRYQAESRDAIRYSRASSIAEALEKYYDQNGEYPSCNQLTQSAVEVSESVLTGFNTDALTTPRGSDNSIVCDDMTSIEDGDYFAYVGDSTQFCIGESGQACAHYTLKYIHESSGQVEEISSRRSAEVTLDPEVPDGVVAQANGSDRIDLSWNSAPGALSYSIEYSTSSSFSSGVNEENTSSTNIAITGLTYNTTYYFRVAGVALGAQSEWSDIVNATTAAPQVGAPTLAVNSNTAITASWTAIGGATSYTVERATTSNFASPTTVTGIVTLSHQSTSLSPGQMYYFRVRAMIGGTPGVWSPTSSASTTISAPGSVTATTDSTSAITVAWGSVTNAQSYTLEYSTASNFSGAIAINSIATTSRQVTGLTANQLYYFRVRAVGPGTNSAWSSTVSSTTWKNVSLSGAVYCSGAYSGRPAFHLRLGLQEVSYNQPANTSNVNWSLYRIRVSTYSGTYDQTKTWPWAVSINGSGWSGVSNSIVFKTNAAIGATEGIASGSLSVAHNADGTKTIGYSASDGPGSNIFGSASCSGSYVLSDLR